MVITGGVMSETRKKASRYNRQGWVEDLPDMSIGRFHHGCAGYTKNGEQVEDFTVKIWYLAGDV